ncbi:unnamed protein product [Pedinophyceae sp. YPF-701]|nr:unnamed protein product [Pedinophyceae sp. YPF-701]
MDFDEQGAKVTVFLVSGLLPNGGIYPITDVDLSETVYDLKRTIRKLFQKKLRVGDIRLFNVATNRWLPGHESLRDGQDADDVEPISAYDVGDETVLLFGLADDGVVKGIPFYGAHADRRPPPRDAGAHAGLATARARGSAAPRRAAGTPRQPISAGTPRRLATPTSVAAQPLRDGKRARKYGCNDDGQTYSRAGTWSLEEHEELIAALEQPEMKEAVRRIKQGKATRFPWARLCESCALDTKYMRNATKCRDKWRNIVLTITTAKKPRGEFTDDQMQRIKYLIRRGYDTIVPLPRSVLALRDRAFADDDDATDGASGEEEEEEEGGAEDEEDDSEGGVAAARTLADGLARGRGRGELRYRGAAKAKGRKVVREQIDEEEDEEEDDEALPATQVDALADTPPPSGEKKAGSAKKASAKKSPKPTPKLTRAGKRAREAAAHSDSSSQDDDSEGDWRAKKKQKVAQKGKKGSRR